MGAAASNEVREPGGASITAQELEALKYGIRTGRIPVREVALNRTNFDELLAYLRDDERAADELALSQPELREVAEAVMQLKPIVQAVLGEAAARAQLRSLMSENGLSKAFEALELVAHRSTVPGRAVSRMAEQVRRLAADSASDGKNEET